MNRIGKGVWQRAFSCFVGIAVMCTLLVVAAPPAFAGSLTLTVSQWSRNLQNAYVTYDMTVSASGANVWGAPCSSTCKWRVEAYYIDASAESYVALLGSGYASGAESFSERLVTPSEGTHYREITHVRATLKSTYSGSWTSDWVQVATRAVGGVDLNVFNWDNENGSVTYDLSLEAWAASRRQGPCESTCKWYVEAYDRSGGSDMLVSRLQSGYATGAWNFGADVTGSFNPVRSVTHLRARVSPSYSGYDTFERWIPISSLVVGNYDLAVLVGVLAAQEVSQDEFCIVLDAEVRKAVSDIDPDSPTPVWKACAGASSLKKAVVAVASVMGGIGISIAIHKWADGRSDTGALGRMDTPAPDPQPEPAPEAAGAGIAPPPNCITDPAVRQALLDSLPEQDHHLATNQNSIRTPQWTKQFEELLAKYFPERTLNEGWNIIEKMKHRDSHPFGYHFWVYQNMRRALRQSNEDWNEFLRRWNLWVKDVVRNDPLLARREYWDC
ncbi:MAG: hypothetical protein ABR505_03555 [Actinomycetota bacterium]